MRNIGLTRWLAGRLYPKLSARACFGWTPDFVIGTRQAPYLRRWYLIPRNRVLNVYLHHFQGRDPYRVLHDHPYASVSLILQGRYAEVTPDGTFLRSKGDLLFRRAKDAHYIDLPALNGLPQSCWSLFITGPRLRDWGFHTIAGWVPHLDFIRSWRNYQGGSHER